ncbi:MAG: hypothetical protein Ta2E_07220 [Mycoplasmoidaceae bacterium]|nr:MAG: hypothetical protein Ta2E_07220 [Mycoplasmoidaceae bacterium]
MNQSTKQQNSNKAPGWFLEWVQENKKEEALYRKEIQMSIIGIKDYIDSRVNEVIKEMRDGFAEQKKFNKEISKRVDDLTKHVDDLTKHVNDLSEYVNFKKK